MTHTTVTCPTCQELHHISEHDNQCIVVIACGKCRTLFAQDVETRETFEVTVSEKKMK